MHNHWFVHIKQSLDSLSEHQLHAEFRCTNTTCCRNIVQIVHMSQHAEVFHTQNKCHTTIAGSTGETTTWRWYLLTYIGSPWELGCQLFMLKSKSTLQTSNDVKRVLFAKYYVWKHARSWIELIHEVLRSRAIFILLSAQRRSLIISCTVGRHYRCLLGINPCQKQSWSAIAISRNYDSGGVVHVRVHRASRSEDVRGMRAHAYLKECKNSTSNSQVMSWLPFQVFA